MKNTLNTTWRHIRRSPYQAMAAILTMTSTFFVVMVFALIFLGSTILLSHLESLPQVTAFFKDEAKQADIDSLRQKIEGTGLAASIKFVSKDDALKIWQDKNKTDPLLLELVTADVLPASLEVSAKQVQDLGSIADMLKSSSAVDEVDLARDVVSKLANFVVGTRFTTTILSVFLFISLVFTTLFIISLRVFVHKEEIETMRLLGAGRWKIFWPFLLEGIFYAAVSAVIAGVFTYIATPFIVGLYKDVLKDVITLPVPITFHLIVIGAGIILGVFASFIGGLIAVNRYIKV